MITAKDIVRMGLDKRRPLTPAEQARADAEDAANRRAAASPMPQYEDDNETE